MIRAILYKEFKHLLSDKGFLLIAMIQPLVFIIMFGSSLQGGDINHLSTVVLDMDNSNYSKYVIDATNKSEFFDIVSTTGTLEENMIKLNNSEIRAIVIIPGGFQENVTKRNAGQILIYLDSSNFMTYSSLKGAKVEIARDTLKNITTDILDELEQEKDEGKKKIDDVKAIFEDIKKESELLEKEIDDLKNESSSINFTEMKQIVNEMNSSLDEQLKSLKDTKSAMDNIISVLNTLETNNATEKVKKETVIAQLSLINNGIDSSIIEIRRNIVKIEKINSSKIKDPMFSKKIEDRLNYIKERFEEADKKSKDINLNFDNLDKDFLSEPISMDEIAIHGPINYFDYLGAGILSFIVFFVCILAPALNIISEKEENTLYRLSTTPASSLTIFIGKFIVYISFGFVEMAYTLLLAIFLYDLRITGHFYEVIIILTLLACSAIAIGLFISSKVKTTQQALGIFPLIVIPSFLISNSFFPEDIMAEYMTYISYITPMTFSNHALNAIMIKGYTLSQIWPDILILCGFIIVPLTFFIISFKRLKY
ncbi:MAG: ABC transporter permease [Candidatus Pacearchaeota archaeon]|jgi:ABC-type multidrug transport system permease subunit